MMTAPKSKGSPRRFVLNLVAVTTMFVAVQAGAANCDMKLSTPDIEYGQLSRADLDMQEIRVGTVSLGQRMATLTVVCERPTTMVLAVSGQQVNAEMFGFASQGHLGITIGNAQLDGRAVGLARSGLPDQLAQGGAPSLTFLPGESVSAVADGAQAIGQRLTAQITVDARVPPSELRVRAKTELRADVLLKLVGE